MFVSDFSWLFDILLAITYVLESLFFNKVESNTHLRCLFRIEVFMVVLELGGQGLENNLSCKPKTYGVINR